MGPLLALNSQSGMSAQASLSGYKRTSFNRAKSGGIEPAVA